MIESLFYEISDEEGNKRLADFKQKYSIAKKLGPNATILAFGCKFREIHCDEPPNSDRPSYWKNKEGHLVIRMEPYTLSSTARKELEAWCEKFEFECIYDNELLPFHNVDDIEVIILVSKIKYRNARECKKRGWL